MPRREDTTAPEETSFKQDAKAIVDEEFAGLTDGAVEDLDDGDEIVTDEDLEDDDIIDEDDLDDDEADDEGAADDDDEHELTGDAEGDTPAEGVDRGDGRDAKGKFATKAEQDAAAAAAAKQVAGQAGAAKPEVAAGDKPAEKPAEGAAQPQFQPFKIRADKEDVAIPEAQVTRANGFVMLAVPEKDFPRFEARIGRGHVAEKVWKRLVEKEKELDAEKSAPPRRSDAEIEASMTLDAIKQHIPDLLTPIEIENLELKIKQAQREYNDTYAAERKTHFETATKETTPEQDEEAEGLKGLAAHLLAFRDDYPEELGDLTPEELQDVYKELAQIRRAVFWKEGGEYFANNQIIAKTLLAAKAKRSTPAADSGALPTGDTAAAAGGSAAPSKAALDAERHNRGVESAAKPSKTTSLKANRGRADARSRQQRNTRGDATGRERERVTSPELDAEEKWRKAQKNFMSSDSLDFDDGSDD